MRYWYLYAVAFLLACEIATAPATFTPGGPLPTVRPYQTTAPSVPQAPEPTPSQEVKAWECNSINGWLLSPHCGLDPWFIAVNTNSNLETATDTVATMHVPLPNGTTAYRTVQYPAPPGLYSWQFETVGHDGINLIRDMVPSVEKVDGGFSANITALTGLVGLRLEQAELFQFPGRYVVGFEMTPVVRLPDVSRNNPALMRKFCTIWTDTGMRYDLEFQNAGHNQYQPVLDSAVYVVAIDAPLGIILECGVQMEQPVFDGHVVFERIFVEPVPPEYGDQVIRIQ